MFFTFIIPGFTVTYSKEKPATRGRRLMNDHHVITHKAEKMRKPGTLRKIPFAKIPFGKILKLLVVAFRKYIIFLPLQFATSLSWSFSINVSKRNATKIYDAKNGGLKAVGHTMTHSFRKIHHVLWSTMLCDGPETQMQCKSESVTDGRISQQTDRGRF